MGQVAMSVSGWGRGVAVGLVVIALAWSVGSGRGDDAAARGIGQAWGHFPVGMVPLTATTGPCRGERVRSGPSRAQRAGPPARLWLVTDCTTEAQRIPTTLQATGSLSSVSVTWTAPVTSGVVQYHVERSVNQGPFLDLAQPTMTSYTDTQVTGTPVTSYVYRVRAEYAGGLISAPSNVDVATTIQFTDDHTLAGKTILAQHLTELRAAVGAVCGTAGETTPTWTDPTITSGLTVIKKIHLDELRAKASECLAAVGVVVPPYSTDPSLTAGITIVKQAHIQELRDAVH